ASMGTLGISAPDRKTVGSLTTPDPAGLHQDISNLAAEGVSHLAVEASSHGLSQYRLDGVNICAAAFTNLTRDHLDYHKSMDEYLAAKTRLFSEIMVPGGTAVLNVDASEFSALAKICLARGHKIISYGLGQGDIRCESIVATPTGFSLEINAQGARANVVLPLIGNFQILNVLCAVGLVLAGGEDVHAVLQTLSALEGAPGRLQVIKGHPSRARIFVDYAHTPEALASMLRALRPHTKGRLSVVFGCGGDRDTGKRPEMGRVAQALANKIIVTDDNPRSEDPSEIRGQVLKACPQAQEIGDRAEAISTAVADLEADDLLIIAGKGHETNQIVGDRVLPFSDVDVTEAALKELGS
ncbi:MAG: UDP-N-acetylmuramoyl-L-alanyl-D-glutamate--2,6-diaminopimelate ligase, partial [Rhodospirillales bacterium]|nr:UDP-N-acetylmuramoyl-L-alanyl-D-glutamate--2,6-diaminopimelate ligase [Rhodospirillales bacterium]